MMKQFLKTDKKIILFDGVCNFCNASVLKIIHLDKNDAFLFSSLQSKIGQELTAHFNIDTAKTDSIILVESAVKFSVRSSAALHIINEFGGVWKLFQLCWIVPKFIRDAMYDFIARNRYKWFGKKEQCMIPTAKIKDKFI